MPVDYAGIAASGPHSALRFWLLSVVGGVVGLVAWCLLDFILVRFAPPRMHDFDWLLFLFPAAIGVAGAALLRRVEAGVRILLSVAAAALASVIAVVLVLLFGVPFHFWMGGTL